jgi:hypothetical protein
MGFKVNWQRIPLRKREAQRLFAFDKQQGADRHLVFG